MYCKKSTPIIIAILLCWSQTSNSFKLPNWLIASSIVGIGGAYFFAKTYKPRFNSLWERLFACNKLKKSDSASITSPNPISSYPTTTDKQSVNKVKKFIFGFRNPQTTINPSRQDNNLHNSSIPKIRLETDQGAENDPTKSCLKPISRIVHNPSSTPIPTTMPSTPEDRALIPVSHAGQLHAQQNPEQPNTFWLPQKLLELFNKKRIDPFSPLCVRLFDGTQTITFQLSDIHAFPDAIKKSSEAAKMLLSAQKQLFGTENNALAFLLQKAIQGLPIKFDTERAITDSQTTPTTHRRKYSSNTSAYGGPPNKDKKQSAYGGTRKKPQQFSLTVQQGDNELRIFLRTPQETYFSEQINSYNNSITPTEDLINNRYNLNKAYYSSLRLTTHNF